MHGLVSGFKEMDHAYVGDCVVGTESLVGFAYYDELMERLDALPEVHAMSPVVKTYGLYTETGTGYSDGQNGFAIGYCKVVSDENPVMIGVQAMGGTDAEPEYNVGVNWTF